MLQGPVMLSAQPIHQGSGRADKQREDDDDVAAEDRRSAFAERNKSTAKPATTTAADGDAADANGDAAAIDGHDQEGAKEKRATAETAGKADVPPQITEKVSKVLSGKVSRAQWSHYHL